MKVQLALRRKEIEELSNEVDSLKKGLSTSYVSVVKDKSFSKS